ncbi:restriction endonuclease [Lacinutrix sp. MedPE-SW]|uniref:restriction endonuclease n=1 Tax=Lacinutrix sp. MedPE-SW TaxID=1860087 RepID=UPI00091127D1|nr:restriction endonuclease [Lacinutrix sp. MedPE-SW]OIQ18738.1 MAG: ATPase [Lacinutrix sp. MedPE-SW]
MENNNIDIIKASGEHVKFSTEKLKSSLHKSGADNATISQIINSVKGELYQGISTKEIYNRAFALLKKSKNIYASKYKLKKAIYELGPTGFPFERFIASILEYSGYSDIKVGIILQGKCVTHEVDVIAKKNNLNIIAECKFHSERKNKCDVKIPLYIQSRYQDIIANYKGKPNCPNQGWVVTNTQFTKDAIAYGKCIGLQLLSWDYPENNALKDKIDRLALYPITVSTLLTSREKQFLLSRDVVLCRQLIKDKFYLDHLGVSEKRKQKIITEISELCSKYIQK